MKKISALILIAALVVATAATAQTKRHPKAKAVQVEAPQKWDREPDTVFGIKLGGLVSELQLPKCPTPSNRYGYYDDERREVTALCIGDFPAYANNLFGTPNLSVPYRATLHFYKDSVRSISLSLQQSDFEGMKTILIERYGQPTSAETVNVTAGSGAKLTSQQLYWRGVKTSITALERVGTIDQSYVFFSDVATVAREAADKESKVKGDASKF